MKYDFSGLPNRIKARREELKMSREQLGKLVGGDNPISRQAVVRWETEYDDPRNSVPKLETIKEIAEALRVPFLWLLTGNDFTRNREGSVGELVPIYALDVYHLKTAPTFYRRTLAPISEGTDGFRVTDTSNSPEYMPLDVVITEPCTEPRPGKMMVARLIEKRMNVFAECTIEGYGVGGKPIFALAPKSKAFPVISSKSEPIELLAVAVEHQKDLRNR